MSYLDERELKAFNRIFAAVQRVKLNLVAHDKIYEAATSHPSVDFIQLVRRALYNDLISQFINVLDNKEASDRKAHSFWWLYTKKKSDIDSFSFEQNVEFTLVDNVSNKLKIIRNGTHHHFSYQYAGNYPQVWKDASLNGDDLINAVNIVWEILSFLNEKQTGDKLEFVDYRGEDAKEATKFVSSLISREQQIEYLEKRLRDLRTSKV